MKSIVILIISLVACLGNGFAQQKLPTSETKNLEIQSLEMAWQYALENNPEQINNQAYIDKSEYDAKVSRSSRFPTISGSFNLQRNLSLATTPLPGEIFGQPGQTIDAQFGQEYAYNTGITISRNIFDWAASVERKIAQNTVSLSQNQANLSEQMLKQQIALYYYTALISQKALEISEEDENITDSMVTISQDKLGEGLIDLATFQQAEINRQRVIQSKLNTQILLNQCEQQLKTLLGLNPNQSLKIENQELNLASKNFDLSMNPDVNIALNENQVDNAKLRVKLQKLAFVPKLNLVNYWGAQQFRDDFGLSFGDGAWNSYNYLGVNLQVPIFTGFANKNRLKGAKVDYRIAQNALQDARRKAQINDQLFIKNHVNYEQLVSSASTNFELYAEKRELSKQKFDAGLISLDAHLAAFEDYLNAENAYLNALTNLYTNYANIISRQ